MIHRALFGSVERFFAILLEHYAGALPTWLMPVQVVVLPVRDDHDDYARAGGRRAAAAPGCASRSTVADEPLNARIRRWKLEKVPYILVVGDDDVAGRHRRGERPVARSDAVRDVALDDFVAALVAEIDAKGSPETGKRSGRIEP